MTYSTSTKPDARYRPVKESDSASRSSPTFNWFLLGSCLTPSHILMEICSFWVILLTDRHTNKRENITFEENKNTHESNRATANHQRLFFCTFKENWSRSLCLLHFELLENRCINPTYYYCYYEYQPCHFIKLRKTSSSHIPVVAPTFSNTVATVSRQRLDLRNVHSPSGACVSYLFTICSRLSECVEGTKPGLVECQVNINELPYNRTPFRFVVFNWNLVGPNVFLLFSSLCTVLLFY